MRARTRTGASGLAPGGSNLAARLIRGYQLLISPLLAPACRFYPSCSEYARIAIERDGILRGGALAVRRVGRCHPFGPGGLDLP